MLRVGILEDNALMRRYLVDLVGQVGGHEAHAFDEPQALWDAVEQGRLDLVVLDIGLGACATLHGENVDGIEVSRLLKAKRNELPVILLTAHAFESDVEAFLAQSGADAYETKPIRDEDALLARIASLAVRQ